MIFTTVVVTCLFALLGVFQQVSVDSLLSTLSHLHTPTLSSITSLLQVASSVTRFTLDTAPLPEVDSFFSQLLPSATLGEAFTSLEIIIPDLPLDAYSYSVPANVSHTLNINASIHVDSAPEVLGRAPLWYRALNFVVRIGSLALAYQIFRAVLPLLVDLLSEQSENSGSPVTGSHSDGLSNGQIVYPSEALPSNDYDEHEPREAAYDPLALTKYTPGPLQHYRLLCAPKPPFVPPSLSTASNLAIEADAEAGRVFGVAPCPPLNIAEDDDVDIDAYLRRALNFPDDCAPPAKGWFLEEEPSGVRPTQDTLDAWVLPRLPVDDSHQDAEAAGKG
ncbi:hypothetical protein BV20DRAFT_1054087 [Pilatotrama ljubarskyi]|nr:hypothetical protein BV20DRAFT_1054087 [Pilatotrama ljubarskyi]